MESHQEIGARIEGIQTILCNCTNCTDTRTMLKLLSDSGVKFLRPIPTDPNRIDSDPYRRIKESGSIIVPLTITHKLLGRDIKLFSLGWETPLAGLGYIAGSRSITIRQTNSTEAETLEEMVKGQIAVAAELVKNVGATYGWVDASSERTLPREVTRFSEVRNWFYCNLFSSRLMSDAPPDFFRDIPAHEKQTLSDGSMLVRSAACYTEWVQTEHDRLKDFLSERAPQIALFRFK